MGSKAEATGYGIVPWEDEIQAVAVAKKCVEGSQLALGAGRLKGDGDSSVGDMDGAGSSEEVSESAFGFGRDRQVWGDHAGELALDIGAPDANGIEDDLVLIGVLDQRVGELGLRERGMRRGGGAQLLEFELLRERLLDLFSPPRTLGIAARELGELTTSVSFANAGDPKGAVEPAARRVGYNDCLLYTSSSRS